MRIALKGSFVLAFGLVAVVQVCHGATLTTNAPVLLGSATGMKVSVYPGKAAYKSSSVSGVFGDGTVIDYRLYNNATLASGGYASGGGGRVSTITTNGGLTDYNMDYTDVWTLNDPGTLSGGIPDFLSTADFTNATMSGIQGVTGTVSVAGLVTGTVYVLCGSYDNIFTVTATLSGSGQPDVTNSITIDPAVSRNTYIMSFGFEDPNGDYDTIMYSYYGTAGNRARFMGVIIDGKTPPAGTVLIIR